MNLVNLSSPLEFPITLKAEKQSCGIFFVCFVFNLTELLNFINILKKKIILFLILGVCVYVCLGEILNVILY